MSAPLLQAVRGRILFPIGAPPIPNGVIVFQDATIVAVGDTCPLNDCLDLGDVALCPGLVNAHTHLEFSELACPLSPAGGFAAWIRRLIDYRRDRSTQLLDRALEHGTAEIVAAGGVAIGDIITRLDSPAPAGGYTGICTNVHMCNFLELIGLAEKRSGELCERADTYLRAGSWRPGRRGISPHAPYTVHPESIAQLVEVAASHSAPMAMHLAETGEELQLLRDRSGPLRELLQELEAWDPEAIRLGSRPLDYLRILARAPAALVIHGNYLQPDEWTYLTEHAQHMTVVYCPRTHRHFGHEPYPLARALGAGASLALGTDSRASNPDLSMLEELRQAIDSHPDVDPQQLLQMATWNGARALGLAHVGRLQPGYDATFLALRLPTAAGGSPTESLWHSELVIESHWYRGERINSNDLRWTLDPAKPA